MKTELKTKPAKTSAKPAPKAKTEVKTKPVTKPAEKAQTVPAKKHVFALVAGTVAKIEHKFLKQAVAYHTAKGSLKKTEAGVALTEQGATLWNKERVAKDPAKFAEIAAWMHGKGECPAEFKGQPPTVAAKDVAFPNILYWGSFSGAPMRAAFAAIWAK